MDFFVLEVKIIELIINQLQKRIKNVLRLLKQSVPLLSLSVKHQIKTTQ